MKKSINSLKNKKIEANQSELSNKCDNQTFNLKKLVIPVDFEDVYIQNKTNRLNYLNSALINIPEDDVKINRVARKQKVFNNGIPTCIEDIYPSNLLAKLCIEFYTSEWIVTRYKDLSYNCSFWSLPNLYSQLSTVREQKFIIDEVNDKDNDSPLTFITKGIYFESQLAICSLDEYEKYDKLQVELELSKVMTTVSSKPTVSKNSTVPHTISHLLCELSDGTKILKESISREGQGQEILYLDIVDSIREIDEFWIHLSFKTNKKSVYLYTCSKENQNLWLTNLNDAIETTVTKVEDTSSLNSMERAEEPARQMLSKILQESDQSATLLRRKDHQSILAICPEIRECITKRSNLSSSYDETLIEKSELNDSLIRLQVEQSKHRQYFKLTAKKLLTSIQIPSESSLNKEDKILPEPFFISCCLIHINDGRRISEEFQWNPNHPIIENLLPQELFINKWCPNQSMTGCDTDLCNKTPLALPTFPNSVLQNCKSFLVKSPYPHDQIGLLIRVDKVFNGIMSSSVDKYSKYGAMTVIKKDGDEEVLILECSDTKTGQSIHKSMATFCANIGNYRMPFCWSFGRLTTKGSCKLRLFKYDNNKTSDEDLFKQVQSLNSESVNKGVLIPGYIELFIEEMAEKRINNMTDLVNNELICKILSNPADQSDCCKEIKEFINDPSKTLNNSSHPNSHMKKFSSVDSSTTSSHSKANINYGSSTTLHYSDDTMSGDITPPYDALLPNPSISLLNHAKSSSPSMRRSSDVQINQGLVSKSFDTHDKLLNLDNSINQEDLVAPFLDFSHSLYLYPRTLNFSNQSSFQRARNLSCFVELRDSDILDTSVPLRVIFSRPSNKQAAFDSWANTSVTYHDSSPTFNEEIKIALPIKLHSKHHFLFRFYHVSCDTAGVTNTKEKSSGKKHVESPVGFAWMPLLDKNLNINSGAFHLPVSTNLVPNYLEDRNQMSHIQWVDTQKSLFSIILKPESTIYTQNQYLHKFFRVCSEKLHLFLANDVNNDDVEIKNAIKALGTVNIKTLISFIGPTFNQLFVIIAGTCTTYPDISKTAITSVITLTSILRSQSLESLSPSAIKRHTKILNNYIKYSFDADNIAPMNSKSTVHESVVQTISDLISPPFRDTNLMHSFLHNSFLLYSIIVKSMIQCSRNQAKSSVDGRKQILFTGTFMSYLENMIHLVVSCILEVHCVSSNQQSVGSPLRNQNMSSQPLVSSANKDLARFISRLLNVADRGFIFRQIHQYMKIINSRIDSNGAEDDNLLRMKFEFLEIICQHEYFLPLNLINPIKEADKGLPLPEILLSEEFCCQHYLVGLMLQQVHQYMCNTHSSASIRRIPFVLLRNMLAKHIFDDRYNKDSNKQSRIAALYLPLVAIILENQRALSMPGSSYSEKSTTQNTDERSLSSRQMNSFTGDTISTHSSIDGSGSEGAGGSIYGIGSGPCIIKSVRSSQAYIGKDGRVESHFLNMIAGLSTEGTFRDLSTRRTHDSDSSSVHSTSTLIGLDEMNEEEDNGSLSEEMVIHTKIELNESSSRRSSLQRPMNPRSTSIGKRSNTGSNLVSQRISSGLGVNTANIMLKKNGEIKSTLVLNEKTQKDVFICLMHIFSAISTEDMHFTICNLTVQERCEFLQLLIYAIHHLKYQGRRVINKFESISKSRYTPAHGQVQLRHNGQRNTVPDVMNETDEGKALLEGNVSAEVGLIALDVLSAYCLAYKQEILTYSPDHVIFRRIIDVYLNLLDVNQSDTVLKHVLVSMRVFVCTFAKVIFTNCHSVISDLSLRVLRYCDSLSTSVRIEACGFLYRMMRCSYEAFNKPGFNRVHLQIIVAVSKLDRIVGRRFNDSLNYLKQMAELEIQKELLKPPIKPKPSLKARPIMDYSNIKVNMQQFFEEVCDLTQRIRTVLMATVRMNEHKDDPEMLVDLQYSLAKSYSSNPALRRTWLEKIYDVHQKTNSRAEMAMCKAHIVAMIAEYLQRKENYSIGCEKFKHISPNIPIEESRMRDDSTQLEVHYSKEEVVLLLREVAQEFDSAGLWEVLRHIYKLVIPMYEKKRDYEQMAQIYEHLASAYSKIRRSEATNQRLIGSYYRVIFYGKPFESLAGKVFIYRLDSGKQFCVAREELQHLFEVKYGADRVQMLVDNYIDQSTLNPEMASIQVTFVDPYFDEEEELDRHSMFETQFNISKFSLETPFIKKSHDDIEDIVISTQTDDLNIQWKRKTILTVEASFPHLKRRLEVVSTKEIDYSPIERAIDEIKSKNRQLIVHVGFSKQQSVVDHKSSSSTTMTNSSHSGNINLLMDMHLTGALLPQVNQGPMAYARVFLHKEGQVNLPIDKVNELKVQFMEFLSLCNLLLCDYYELMSHVHDPKYRAMRSALDKYRIELCNLLKEEITVDHERMIISSSLLADRVKNNLMTRLGTDSHVA